MTDTHHRHPQTDTHKSAHFVLAQSIADNFSTFPQVEAVTLSGSVTSGSADPESDIDLYVYITNEIPVSARSAFIEQRATRAVRAEVDNHFWETGDEWIEAASSMGVDLMYRDPNWVEDELQRLLERHQASVGYSTAIWHNILHSAALFDRSGRFARLQKLADHEYPEELRRAIVAKNHPILRDNISSYLHQLEKAVRREDLVSANHRVAALLASYFDIIFAVNRTTHPGEKRLLKYASGCEKTPPHMVEQVEGLLQVAGSLDVGGQLCKRAVELVDSLDALLIAEGLLVRGSVAQGGHK